MAFRKDIVKVLLQPMGFETTLDVIFLPEDFDREAHEKSTALSLPYFPCLQRTMR